MTKTRKAVALGVGVPLVLLLAALVTQYLRSGWPFAPSAATEHLHEAAQQPAPMAAAGAHALHASDAGTTPEGYAGVSIDAAQAKALQLTTALVEEREFNRVVRTVGVVTLDETRSAHVHSKVRGWIDGIHVNFVGMKVAAGDPLCSIYSQDVYSAELEFLSMLGRGQGVGDPMVEASRRRLALWDVPKSELRRLQTTREPRRTFPLLAPRDGTVISKEAIQGMYVDPSLELYTLSDLSKLWVLVDIYEADVPYVNVGDRARLAIEGEPTAIEAEVSFLSPTIDEATRTRKVRFEVPNPEGRLLPGAFASVELELHMGKGLAVPETAIIRTGTRAIAFVSHGEHLEPREVTLGPLAGDFYRVEAGLAAGENVATGAQFLIDSESRLRASSGSGAAHAH